MANEIDQQSTIASDTTLRELLERINRLEKESLISRQVATASEASGAEPEKISFMAKTHGLARSTAALIRDRTKTGFEFLRERTKAGFASLRDRAKAGAEALKRRFEERDPVATWGVAIAGVVVILAVALTVVLWPQQQSIGPIADAT